MVFRPAAILIALVVMQFASGCGSAPVEPAAAPPLSDAMTGLTPLAYEPVLLAAVAPPQGWAPERLESSSRQAHQVWRSPTGRTAYGVIRFTLPLPVGKDLVLWLFLREMRRSQGEARLLERQYDTNRPALRFVAQGGLYTVRTTLFLRGFEGWAVYVGTLSGQPPEPEELALAERAREHTLVGRARAFASE